MFSTRQQIEQARQEVAQAGFSGTATVDSHIYKGFIRLKVEVNPPENLAEFMVIYTDALVMILAAMNLNVGVYIDKDL